MAKKRTATKAALRRDGAQARRDPPWRLVASAGAIGLLAGLGLSVSSRGGERGSDAAAVLPRPSPAAQGSPADVPVAQWRQILKRTYADVMKDQIPAWAAGATFFGLLGLFPALSAFVSLYGLVGDAQDAGRKVQGLAGLLPGGAVSVLTDQMRRLSAEHRANLGLAFAGSLLFSMWSANAGVKALFGALNAAYDTTETRSFIRLNLVSLAFTAGLVALALLAVISVVAAPEALRAAGLGTVANFAVLRWPAVLVVVGLVFSLLYQYGPCRPTARWRWVTPGGAFAAVVWLAMSVGFSWYVANFGHYNATYGALGGVVGFMTWIWLSLIVVLVGAELNSEIERQSILRGGGAGRPRQANSPTSATSPVREGPPRRHDGDAGGPASGARASRSGAPTRG